ncbi:MAG: hypothetical protein IJD11_01435 [Oscillospiraceae bacterium]|nr:hypothetical protein [Oscillospiraceae bacterium]
MKTILAILLTAGIFLNLLGCNATPKDGSSSGLTSSDNTSGSADSTLSEGNGSNSTGQTASGTIGNTVSNSTGQTGSTGTQQGTASTNRPTVSVGGGQVNSTPQQQGDSNGEISFFEMDSPMQGELLIGLKPTFSWKAAVNADSYTLTLEEMRDDGTFQQKMVKKGIKATKYTVPSALKANVSYRWSVTAVNNKYTMNGYQGEYEKLTFMPVSYKEHAANKGLNFTFKEKVSEEVLRNYLSRSMIATVESSNTMSFREHLRMILYTGAKYIGRAEVSWMPNGNEYTMYEYTKENLAYAHALDPEIVFEACIFETTSRKVEQIPIPDWVFKAFGQPVEKRNFSYDKMVFTDGLFKNQWGNEASVPDMTRIETQMFFYYRACTYIDLGFEGLHMGQIHLMGARDSGWKSWHKMISMVREYAKTHARRGFVFINAHTHGMKGPDGKLLFDFHAFPYRGVAPSGSTAHAPSQDNPQEIELQVGYVDSIYKKSMGGTTYSGWSCDSLPYFVELDNWSGYGDGSTIDKPIYGNIAHWGGDEITWFANQPQWYRHYWLKYAYDWVNSTDPAGYAQMPGNRTAALRNSSGGYQQLTYYCNSSEFHKDGFDDEACIRQIWVNDRKSR